MNKSDDSSKKDVDQWLLDNTHKIKPGVNEYEINGKTYKICRLVPDGNKLKIWR